MWEPGPPASEEALAGATLILNISASPYHAGKGAQRELMFAERARENLACVAFCALVGGQDELVFDGHSFVLDHTGEPIARAAQFQEELLVCEVDLDVVAAARQSARNPEATGPPTLDPQPPSVELIAELSARVPTESQARGSTERENSLHTPLAPEEAEVYAALTLGLRDYVEKNGFTHVVLGLSGGIDSALVGCLAADALGSERVSAAIMPSPYSSPSPQQDALPPDSALG